MENYEPSKKNMKKSQLRKIVTEAFKRRDDLIKRTRFLFEFARRNRNIQSIVEAINAFKEIKALSKKKAPKHPKFEVVRAGINILNRELKNPFFKDNPDRLWYLIGNLNSPKLDARLYALGLILGLQNIELVPAGIKERKIKTVPVDFMEQMLPSSEPFGTATSLLSSPNEYGDFGIVGFDKGEKTIVLKIRIDRNVQDIQQDIADLYYIIHKEARIKGYPMKKTKKRKTKESESLFDKYELYIKVFDSIEKDRKTPMKVAREIFKEEFYDPAKLKESDPIPDSDRARKKVEYYYKEAKKMVDGGFGSI